MDIPDRRACLGFRDVSGWRTRIRGGGGGGRGGGGSGGRGGRGGGGRGGEEEEEEDRSEIETRETITSLVTSSDEGTRETITSSPCRTMTIKTTKTYVF